MRALVDLLVVASCAVLIDLAKPTVKRLASASCTAGPLSTLKAARPREETNMKYHHTIIIIIIITVRAVPREQLAYPGGARRNKQ